MTRCLAFLATVGLAAVPAVAQSPIYASGLGTGDVEIRDVSFGTGIRLQRASQFAMRFAGGIPLVRRVFLDASANYGVTHLRSDDSIEVNLNGLTDTQLRAVYTLGRDLGAVSLQINLPTGEERVPEAALPLLRSIAQEFLPFPISSYGMGFGVTAGTALARRFGPWTVGAAGSLRYLGSYSPFTDVDGEYQPGVEGRLRVGARRLFARSTVLVGLTVSTFGTDEFAGQQQFTYRAGPRVVAEGQVTYDIGRTTARASAWGYFRASGDSSGVAVSRAQERILHGATVWSVPLSGTLTLDPGIDARSWHSADNASGWLLAFQAGARWWATPRLAVAPGIRLERGDVQLEEGIRAGFFGVTGSLVVRLGG